MKWKEKKIDKKKKNVRYKIEEMNDENEKVVKLK
jgi:hypothetical protein